MKKTILFLLFTSALWACSETQKEVLPSSNNYTEEVTVFFEDKTFHLKGRLDASTEKFEYETSADLKAVEALYEEYSELSTVANMKNPNTVHLFKDQQTASSFLSVEIKKDKKNQKTNGLCGNGTISLYDGSNFSGYSVHANVSNCNGYSLIQFPMFEHPYFWGKDRKITVSSAKVVTDGADDDLVLTLYEDINYNGKSLQLYSYNGNDIYEYALYRYSFGYFHSWNDKASSLRVQWWQ